MPANAIRARSERTHENADCLESGNPALTYTLQRRHTSGAFQQKPRSPGVQRLFSAQEGAERTRRIGPRLFLRPNKDRDGVRDTRCAYLKRRRASSLRIPNGHSRTAAPLARSLPPLAGACTHTARRLQPRALERQKQYWEREKNTHKQEERREQSEGRIVRLDVSPSSREILA